MRTTLLFLSLPLASAAQSFIRCSGWKEFGYARLSDHARERWARSSGWLCDLAALNEAVERLPGLSIAVTGEDGGRPIGTVAARYIGQVASGESLSTWLSIARARSVRELKNRTRQAILAGSCWPEAEPHPSDDAGPSDPPHGSDQTKPVDSPQSSAHSGRTVPPHQPDQAGPAVECHPPIEDPSADDEPGRRACLPTPAAVQELFAEGIDLLSALEGSLPSQAELIDSMIAETASGSLAGKLSLKAPGHVAIDSRPDTMALSADGRAERESGSTAPPVAHAVGIPTAPPVACPAAPTTSPPVACPAAPTTSPPVAHPPAPTTVGHSPILNQESGATIAAAFEEQIRHFISQHEEAERQLAEVVTEIAQTAAWRVLGYDGLDRYARCSLGWSRSTLYSCIQMVRQLRRLPLVRQAYLRGDICRIAAQTIARMLTRPTPAGTIPLRIPASIQQAWVDRATTATVKRLRDEVRAATRLMVLSINHPEFQDDGPHPPQGPAAPHSQPQAQSQHSHAQSQPVSQPQTQPRHRFPRPLDDAAWHESLYRQVGAAQRRAKALTAMAMAAPGPLLPLRLTLNPQTAANLRQVLAVACQDPDLVRRYAAAQPGHSTAETKVSAQQNPDYASPCSGKSSGPNPVRTFGVTSGRVPEWVALLALLNEFIETWDVDLAGRRPSAQRIYVRDGWRCMAPGCTSRKNLEVHHVVYRSQEGTDRDENLVCLCRFHHQMGEHGLLARVQGEAPLGLAWSLGRDGCGGRFKNELRLANPG